jgi:hypothetical protein
LDPFDLPPPPFGPPKPKSIGIVVSGGNDYRTKEVKIVKLERMGKKSHRVVTCSSDRCTNDVCILEKKDRRQAGHLRRSNLDTERRDCGGSFSQVTR